MCNLRCSRGFSLLEVLVAFAILALALGILYQIYGKGTQSIILGKEYSRAVTIAQSRLAMLGTEDSLKAGQQQGVENDKYQWSTNVEPFEENTDPDSVANVTLHKIDVEVSWESLGKLRSIKLESLRLLNES